MNDTDDINCLYRDAIFLKLLNKGYSKKQAERHLVLNYDSSYF